MKRDNKINAEKDNKFLSNKTLNIYKTPNCSAQIRRVDKNLVNKLKSKIFNKEPNMNESTSKSENLENEKQNLLRIIKIYPTN